MEYFGGKKKRFGGMASYKSTACPDFFPGTHLMSIPNLFNRHMSVSIETNKKKCESSSLI